MLRFSAECFIRENVLVFSRVVELKVQWEKKLSRNYLFEKVDWIKIIELKREDGK